MAKQSHFVVMIDENGQATIDYDTSINFGNGDVWDEDRETWFDRNEAEVSSEYEVAEALLLSLLKQTWRDK
jgi:hypothetical protein